MLHRKDPDGLLIISQPAHAWVSGQISRHWGGGAFDPLSEEVCLAAELHDIGFLDWEESPTLNPETGLPHDFLNMPPQLHMGIWRAGVRHMMRFGRYPALLVSLHFSNICRQNWVSRKKDGVARDYLEEQEALQRTLLTSLENDYYYGADLSEQRVTKDQQMVSILDWISLIALMGIIEEKCIDQVPCGDRTTPMKVTPKDKAGKEWRLDPWPLSVPELTVVCEAKRLLKTFKTEEEMREAIQGAARISVVTKLVKN